MNGSSKTFAPSKKNSAVYLGLDARASFAFEDYLLSRYHMFMSVYFHQIPIGYEVMLKRFHAESETELVVPSNVEAYLEFDDVTLLTMLRKAKSEWARRVVERRAYRMLIEAKEIRTPEDASAVQIHDVDAIEKALAAHGIRSAVHVVKGQLSKYFQSGGSRPPMETPPLYIVDDGTTIPVESYTPLYRRYSGAIHLRRIYVDPSQLDEARNIRMNLLATSQRSN